MSVPPNKRAYMSQRWPFCSLPGGTSEVGENGRNYDSMRDLMTASSLQWDNGDGSGGRTPAEDSALGKQGRAWGGSGTMTEIYNWVIWILS